MNRLAIIRTSSVPLDLMQYHVQEIGLARGLLKQGVSTDIYSRFANLEEERVYCAVGGCAVRLIPVKGMTILNQFTCVRGLIDRISREHYDCVQVHERNQPMTPFLLRHFHKEKIKTVLYQGIYKESSFRSALYNAVFDFFFGRTVVRNTDVALAKTGWARERLLRKGFKDVSIMPVGLGLAREYKPCAYRQVIERFKQRYSGLLLYIGKLEKRRNPFFMVDVLAEVRETHKRDVGLAVIGTGPLEEQMREYAEKKGLSEHILFIRRIQNLEMHEVNKLGDLLLLPSNYEIYGMVMLEAMQHGLPIVATPEAGPQALLTDPRLGSCIGLNVATWGDKICGYLDNTLPEAKAFRSDHFAATYDFDKIAKHYYDVVLSA